MPLFYQHNINQSARLAVWKITEPEDFFLKKVTIQKEITHLHKRLQHLAGRYLLQILDPGFPMNLIEISETKKPLLANSKWHFSISHCGDFAAAIISETRSVGIDVEVVTPKIGVIKDRFLSENELHLIQAKNRELPITMHEIITLFWSAKESIFKWYGKGNLSFKNNMRLYDLYFENEAGIIKANFIKDGIEELNIAFVFFENLCLSWV